FDAVIERVKELDNDPDKYLAMLRENPMQPDFDFDRQEKYIQWLISIIEKGNNAINKDPCRMNEKSLKRTIRSLKQENADLKAQIENSKSDDFVELTNKNKLLSEENVQLRENVQNMEKRLKDIAKPKPFLEFPTKSTGNFLCRRIEKNGYVKTYICGICIRKRPVNLCQFIDSRLYELEKRIKASQN
ncbi:MAG: hypothetical protein J6W96_01315, partial [Alphaproteobacteria bacterium]|nr:hypothetical protein [Alphaproteobacteria bacterium]